MTRTYAGPTRTRRSLPRKIGRIALLSGFVALMALAGGCASDAGPESSGARVTELPRPTTGPYVVVAVDNHFHDIHPEDDIEVAASRPFVVKNEGRNLHNFSVAGTGISHDIRPGKQFRLAPVGDFLPPGDYTVFCKYHDSMGMNGSFTVVEG